MKAKLAGYFLIIITCTSCAAYQLDNAQTQLRTSFASGNYENAVTLLEDFEQQQIYQDKDLVLLNLEHGMVNHFAGNYRESSQFFSSAENKIDDLFTKSVSRAIKSFVVNDNSLDYDGEDYEDIYINIFKCLNYIHLNELESALVEARRVAYKLGRIDVKYKGLVESLAQADTTNSQPDKWKTGKTNIQKSPLGHYLSAILFAKTDKPDDARIEYVNVLKAYEEHTSVLENFTAPNAQELEIITNPDEYNLLVNVFAGRSPVKHQNDIRLYLEESDTYLKFSLPTLEVYDSKVHRIEVVLNDQKSYELPIIESMDMVAKEVYKVKEPIIYARTLVRTTLKAVAASQLKQKAAKEDAVLGTFVNILGKVAQETTEKADLRSWQTMPGKAYAKVIKVPAGNHEVKIKYYNRLGTLLYVENKTLEISDQDELKLIESIYWN